MEYCSGLFGFKGFLKAGLNLDTCHLFHADVSFLGSRADHFFKERDIGLRVRGQWKTLLYSVNAYPFQSQEHKRVHEQWDRLIFLMEAKSFYHSGGERSCRQSFES